MKKFVTAAMALSVLGAVTAAGTASAQPDPNRHERFERHDDRFETRAERRYKAGRYQPPRGYQARHWRQGERLPPAYRGRAYAVDYHRYGLRAPPRGYQYVRVGDDVVLTAVATGLISSVIVQMFQ